MPRLPSRAAVVVTLVACAALPAAAAAKIDSGVKGRATVGPTCPVVRPGEDCADAPYRTHIRIHRVPGRVLVADRRTGKDGRFRVRLEPGRYRLRQRFTKDSQAWCPSVEFEVKAHAFTRVNLPCDNGMR